MGAKEILFFILGNSNRKARSSHVHNYFCFVSLLHYQDEKINEFFNFCYRGSPKIRQQRSGPLSSGRVAQRDDSDRVHNAT